MPYQRVLVPLSGKPGDDHALKVAIGLTRRSRAVIYAIHVVEVKQALPLDADLPDEVEYGEAALTRSERICREEKSQIEAELLQARDAGPAIVDEAAQRGVDLIIMSATSRYRRGEYTLGHTVPYVLKYAPCEVWVLRQPQPSA